MSFAATKTSICPVLAVCLFAATATAQDYNRNAPKTPPRQAPSQPTGQRTDPESSVSSSAVPFIPVLKGLVFVANSEAVQRAGVSVDGISVGNIEMLQRPGIQDKLAAYLGQPLSLKQLSEITNLVVEFYRHQDEPIVDVTVPEQDVQKGTIQIIVTEFRVGEVRVSGNRWFSDNSISSPLTLRHGDFINTQHLLGELDALNSNAFRRVDLVYVPSPHVGYTDLELKTQDRFPLRVYAGIDNSGTPITGRSRWSLGVNWGNAFWHDQQLSYQFSTSNDLFDQRPNAAGASFIGHAISWTMPFRWRDSLSIFGVYQQSVPNVGQYFGLVGRSGQASIRYTKVLPRTKKIAQSLQFGYDFKTTNNNLDFGGTTVSANTTEIDQFPLIYSANILDAFGSTGSTTTLVISPGGITPNNTNQAFQPGQGQSGRFFATSNYFYVRQDMTRLTKLPVGTTWALRVLGQASNRPLLNTEQLGVGGSELLRGYDPYTILGDQGVVLSNELRAPPLSFKTEHNFWNDALRQTQFLTFWDYASLHNRRSGDGVLQNINASSTGVGLRYNFRTYTSLRLDYGWQMRALPEATNQGHLLSFGVIFGN